MAGMKDNSLVREAFPLLVAVLEALESLREVPAPV